MSPRPQRQDERGGSLAPNPGSLSAGAETSSPSRTRRPASRVRSEAEWEPLNTYLPADLRHELRVLCASRQVEIRSAVSEAVRAWIQKNGT